MTAQTLAYFPPDGEENHITAFPKLNGWECRRWAAYDIFHLQQDAFRLLAKMALGRVDYGDAEDLAREFFEKHEEEPYNYYNPDEDEEGEEEAP